MPHVSSIERIGIEKGREEGLTQGQARILQKQLAKRFGMLSNWAPNNASSPPSLSNWKTGPCGFWTERPWRMCLLFRKNRRSMLVRRTVDSTSDYERPRHAS